MLTINKLNYHYKKNFRKTHVIKDISFSISKGETVGILGENGSGKTTICNLLVNLLKPTSGEILFNNTDISKLRKKELKKFKKDIQMIFQNPHSSINPKMRVLEIISEPLTIHMSLSKSERFNRISELLHLVGLSENNINKYPHELSGGEKQRLVIARALATEPEFLICDEAVSSLDVSIQAQIINLLLSLQENLHLTYLLISHSLPIIKCLSDRIVVIYFGTVMEIAPCDELFKNPLHPYTRTIFKSALLKTTDRLKINKKVSPKQSFDNRLENKNGCQFAQKCPYATKICLSKKPPEIKLGTRTLFCHHKFY